MAWGNNSDEGDTTERDVNFLKRVWKSMQDKKKREKELDEQRRQEAEEAIRKDLELDKNDKA